MEKKSSGIARRIDALGRIVIPKEIRRTLRWREGDEMEFWVEDGCLVLQKTSPVGNLGDMGDIIRAAFRITGCSVLICDRDHVTTAYRVPEESYANRPLAEMFTALLYAREPYIRCGEQNPVPVIQGSSLDADVVQPIRNGKDVTGAVVLLKPVSKKSQTMEDTKMGCALLLSEIIASMLEAE